MSNRKKIEQLLYDILKDLKVDRDNVPIYKSLFKGMSERQFKDFMEDIRVGRKVLSIVVPGEVGIAVDVAHANKVAKRIGYKLFGKLITVDADGVETESNTDVLFLDSVCRRVTQSVEKGIGVPDDDEHVDVLTAQPTKKSSGASITRPEVDTLAGLGLTATGREFNKHKAGDVGGYNAMTASILAKGTASQREITPYETGVQANKVLTSFYIGIHINPTSRE